jgi:hypothetical protein
MISFHLLPLKRTIDFPATGAHAYAECAVGNRQMDGHDNDENDDDDDDNDDDDENTTASLNAVCGSWSGGIGEGVG